MLSSFLLAFRALPGCASKLGTSIHSNGFAGDPASVVGCRKDYKANIMRQTISFFYLQCFQLHPLSAFFPARRAC